MSSSHALALVQRFNCRSSLTWASSPVPDAPLTPSGHRGYVIVPRVAVGEIVHCCTYAMLSPSRGWLMSVIEKFRGIWCLGDQYRLRSRRVRFGVISRQHLGPKSAETWRVFLLLRRATPFHNSSRNAAPSPESVARSPTFTGSVGTAR